MIGEVFNTSSSKQLPQVAHVIVVPDEGLSSIVKVALRLNKGVDDERRDSLCLDKFPNDEVAGEELGAEVGVAGCGEVRERGIEIHILYCYPFSETLQLEEGDTEFTYFLWSLIEFQKGKEQLEVLSLSLGKSLYLRQSLQIQS